MSLSGSISQQLGRNLFRCCSLTTRRALCSKTPKDELEKELEKLNEKLKKDFDNEISKGYSDESTSSSSAEKNFMNFKQQSERVAYSRSMIFNWKVAAATFAIGGSCLAALFYIRQKRVDKMERQRKLTAGKARIGGDWELLNTEGKTEGSDQLKGSWVLMYFGFTHCPDICPDEIEKMIKVVDILEKEKDEIPIVPVFISVDPARDTIARVKEYCGEFSPKLRGFSGDQDQVNKVAKTFRVYHSQGPKTTPDDYIVDHTVIMYLIDPEGNFHDYYGQNRKAAEIANIIRLKVLKYQASRKSTGILGF